MNIKTANVYTEPTTHELVEQVYWQMQAAGAIPQHWCDACAKPTWVVTPAEAMEIVSLSPNYYSLCSPSLFDKGKVVEVVSLSPGCFSATVGKTGMKRAIHIVSTSTGLALVCLKSLFQCLFPITNEGLEPTINRAKVSPTSTTEVSVVVTNVVIGQSRFESIASIDRHSDLNRLIHSHR